MKTTARWQLWLEWICLFCVYPLVEYFELLDVSKFVLFAVPVAYAGLVYWRSRPHVPRPGDRRMSLGKPVWRAAAVTLCVAAYAWLAHRDSFLDLPRERPGLWLLILCLYPFLSALPQEFVYRKFYFWRYEAILGKGWLAVGSNAAAFSFMHIIYDNLTAVVLTLVGGWLFATTYLRSGRLWRAWLEHTVYGLAVFTFGLGDSFYESVGERR